MGFLKNNLKKIIESTGYVILNKKVYEKLINKEKELGFGIERTVEERLFQFASGSKLEGKVPFSEFGFFKTMGGLLEKSKSQLFQDLFVLYCTGQKQKGFFIEFGATDGISLSNSWLLEKEFQWNGILCEPGKVWHKKLHINRNCSIDERCVWTKTGESLVFNEAIAAELSTLNSFSDLDHHSKTRAEGKTYNVQTISLNDLLIFHKAPAEIDYLSIDTEGSELEILQAFDFSKYSIQLISVEHNHTSKREQIYGLLTKNGFARVFTSISHFDDWYVKESLLSTL